MPMIELRSDTMTRPSPARPRALAAVEVGDDVFGEDPTVNRLEAKAAELLGKEAALLVASGTMANLASLLAHCGRGDEVILGHLSHSFIYEQGGMAAVGGICPRTVLNREDGTLRPEEIEAAVRGDNVHFPRSRLLMIENTHNLCGGAPLDAAFMRAAAEIARRHGLRLHVDGARLFNAAAALGVSARELAAEADSVNFCLSKGLAAPVGSVICGGRDFIEQARRARKLLGGGMRQAGIIAAAGIIALEEMVDRLAEDHLRARKLAEGLAAIPGIAIDPDRVRTNIVYFDVSKPGLSAAELLRRLEREGIRMLATGARTIRAVTHYEVTAADIDHALSMLAKLMN